MGLHLPSRWSVCREAKRGGLGPKWGAEVVYSTPTLDLNRRVVLLTLPPSGTWLPLAHSGCQGQTVQVSGVCILPFKSGLKKNQTFPEVPWLQELSPQQHSHQQEAKLPPTPCPKGGFLPTDVGVVPSEPVAAAGLCLRGAGQSTPDPTHTKVLPRICA